MHLDEERIRRFLDGELPDRPTHEAREHLAACADCRRRVDDARRQDLEVDFLLRGLDHAAPPVRVEDVVQAAAVRRRAGDMPFARVAAGFAIAAALAGAAYALPGSPVPRWVSTVAEWIAARPTPPVSDPAAPDTGLAGIAIVPGDEFVIEFAAIQSQGVVRVSITDSRELTVRAPIGGVSFGSDVDHLAVDNRGSSAAFDVGIPRSAPRVEIRLRGRVIFLKQDQSITTRAVQVARDAYFLPLTPAEP